MSKLAESEERLGKTCASGCVGNADVLKLIEETEDIKVFLDNGNFDEDILASFLNMIVEQLNHKEVHEHTKTRLLLVLNNCAMYRKVRPAVFSSIKYLDLNMEASMKHEGTMAFDSELGRMSEHMLVLLCRVRNYKVKAVEVLEFAEGNVQFAVQLLLAILLKEPAYEFELRVNCMTALLGFSHPATFFRTDEEEVIQEKALTDFEDKVNHICKLTKRLLVVRVVAQVISQPHLMQDGPVTPVVHAACMSMMKFITNVYNYATQQTTSFRQHIITSTSWVDHVVLPYICKLIQQVAETFEMHNQKIATSTSGFNPLQPPPKPGADIPTEVKLGLLISLRFLALCTFHMGSYGRSIRFINSFTYDMFRLPLEFIVNNLNVYGALLQFNVNIDSLAGDAIPQSEVLPVECKTESIVSSLDCLLGALSRKETELLVKHFGNTADSMLARDVQSFNVVNDMLEEAVKAKQQDAAPKVVPVEAKTGDFRLLGDLPDPKQAPRQVQQDTGEELEKREAIVTDDKLVRPKAEADAELYVKAEGDAPASFRCSLNGHLMKQPVRSPHGHVFEKDSIEKWIQQAGSTCPFTGKPLTLDDLQLDTNLMNEITAWHIKAQSKINQEDDFDVYDF